MRLRMSSRHILLVGIVLLCCGVVFYFMNNRVNSDVTKARSEEFCRETCLDVLKMEEKQQVNICKDQALEESKEENIEKNLVENIEKSVSHDYEIVILVWIWPFGAPFDVNSCKSIFGIRGCRITDDRSQYNNANAVLFHVRDIAPEIPELLQMSRPPLQMWVWMNSEPPAYTPRLPGAEDLFNLTSNYRRDSDVWSPYGRLLRATDEEKKAFKIPKKDKLVCWIVSHWDEENKRVIYFNEFSQHISVDGYGQHFGRSINNQEYFRVISSCKFYLSFENSIYKDYISEKFFNPMRVGTVPVVMGPPRENYEEFIPGDAFIHVDDFQTPKDLADHLKHLDQNQDLYEHYFTWRKHFTAHLGHPQEHACRTCEYLRMFENFRVFKNVDEWYFT